MRVILDKLWNEPVMILSVAGAVGAYYATNTVWGPVVSLIAGALTRQFTVPARTVEEVPVEGTNPSYKDLNVEVVK